MIYIFLIKKIHFFIISFDPHENMRKVKAVNEFSHMGKLYKWHIGNTGNVTHGLFIQKSNTSHWVNYTSNTTMITCGRIQPHGY
jgi:hypothetical protein